MKCPDCRKQHPVKMGMTCSCGYRFALNPKLPNTLSDGAFAAVVRRLSGPEEQCFTRDQLIAGVVRELQRRARIPRFAALLGWMFLAALVTLAVLGWFVPADANRWLIGAILFGTLFAAAVFRVYSRPARDADVSAAVVIEMISAYTALHPPAGLITEADLNRNQPPPLPPEDPADLKESAESAESAESNDPPEPGRLLTKKTAPGDAPSWAPEHILIVDKDELAEMLIRNRFPMDRKTLVLSQNRYPAHAFAAYQSFRRTYPDIPVLLYHDCSADGIRMQGRLQKDPDWMLGRDAPVNNLGIHPQDADQWTRALWFPPDPTVKEAVFSNQGLSADHLKAGNRIPAGAYSSRRLMDGLGLAAATGLALGSMALMEEQRNRLPDSSFYGGSFG